MNFTAVSARYVRLTATTEAGNRGPWSSAAEINLLGPSLGSWGPTINFPLVPAAAALLPGNRMLTWSAYSPTAFGGSRGYTQASILNLSTGVVSPAQVVNTGHDMFCPGTSMLPDGKILISGGSNSSKTTLYNPATNAWSAGPDMMIPRGYQSNVTTSTGEVFTIGGSWSGGSSSKHGEVWSAEGGWRLLPDVPVDSTMTADPRGAYRADNHTWLFAASGGRVFQAGPSRQMNWISTTGNGSITSAGNRSDSADAMNGNAVMYDVGKILTVGGAPAYDDTPATERAYTIDINNGGHRGTDRRHGRQPVVRERGGTARWAGVRGRRSAHPGAVQRHRRQDVPGNLEPGHGGVDHPGPHGHSPDLPQRRAAAP